MLKVFRFVRKQATSSAIGSTVLEKVRFFGASLFSGTSVRAGSR